MYKRQGLLRYAMHTLSFDESNEIQRKWALYSGCTLIQKVRSYIQKTKSLRIDFLKYDDGLNQTLTKKIGLTILPGRKDRGRSLNDDILEMKKQRVKFVISLITEAEYSEYGVTTLKEEYKKANIEAYYLPIFDQRIPSIEALKSALQWMDTILTKHNDNLLIHCVGGLGRSGTLAAAYLIWKEKFSSEKAIQIVRASRSERAIESREQEDFLSKFANDQ